MALALWATPALAANCPECEEYTLDIPDPKGDGGGGGNNSPSGGNQDGSTGGEDTAPAPVAAPPVTAPEPAPAPEVATSEPEKKAEPKPKKKKQQKKKKSASKPARSPVLPASEPATFDLASQPLDYEQATAGGALSDWLTDGGTLALIVALLAVGGVGVWYRRAGRT